MEIRTLATDNHWWAAPMAPPTLITIEAMKIFLPVAISPKAQLPPTLSYKIRG